MIESQKSSIMKKNILLILLCQLSYFSYSQCPANSTENELSPKDASSDGFEQILSTTVETFEFFVVNNLTIGHNYQFISSRSGNNDYITITDGSNVVKASGISPLDVNNIQLSSVRIHIRVDEACNTDTYIHKVTLVDLTVAPSTCQKPVSPGISYNSDTRIDFYWSPPTYSTPIDYYWEIVPAGNAQGVGVINSGFTGGVTNASTGNILSPNTFYSIYIRSNCGGNGNSAFLGPLTPLYPTNSVPPPINDFCSGAITLIEQTGIPNAASATSTDGDLLGGAGTDVNAESCNGKTGNSRDDVWYKFVAKTTDVHITVEPNPSFDAVVTFYSGNCNSLTYLACSDFYNNSLSAEEIYYSGLTIGQIYYIRTYFYGTIKPTNLNFGIKVWSTVAATDVDNDGYVATVDCDDNDAKEYPGQIWYLDADADGYSNGTSTVTCERPTNYYTVSELTQINGDCDDSDSDEYPGQTWYLGVDSDGDGFIGSQLTNDCENPGGYSLTPPTIDDCDDTDSDEFPGQTWYLDADADGYSNGTSKVTCERPTNYYTVSELTQINGDCNDSNVNINPGETEIEGNGLDDDCNPSTPDVPLSVDEFNLDKVKISPNPFNQSIKIQLPLGYNNDNFSIGLYDLNGREIFRKNVFSNNSAIIIDHLSILQQGLYFIKITSKEDYKSVVRELIKY